MYVQGGSLTVNDSATGGKIYSEFGCGINVYGDYTANHNAPITSTLVINKAIIDAQEYGIGVHGQGASVYVNNGSISSRNNCGIGGNGTKNSSADRGGYYIEINGGTITGNTTSAGWKNCGLYHPNSGNVVINGGTIVGTTGAGIVVRGGNLTVNAGTIMGKGATVSANGDKMGDAVPTYCGGIELGYSVNYPGGMGVIKIAGGNVSSETSKAVLVIGTPTAGSTISVTGGTFTSDPSAYVSSPYVVSGSGTSYSVGIPYVAPPATSTTTTTTTPTTPTGGTGTETPVATVTTTTQPTVTVTDNTAKVTVPAEDTAKIVEQTAAAEKAAADAGTKVESNIVISAGTSTAAKTEVVLPAATVNDIATKTDASLTVETPAGDAKIDPEVLDKAAETAGTSGNVTLVIEKIALETLPAEAQEALGKDAIVVKVELITDNGNITTFPEGSGITLSLALDPSTDVSTKRFVYVTSTGVITELPYKVINGKAVAKLPHLSYYAFMDKAQADAAIAAQNAKIKAGVQATKVISLKAALTKGKVKLTWSKTAGYKMDGYQIYKSSKSAGGYKLMKTAAGKYYINTMGLKAGNTYYYKVRGFRTIDGVKVYTSFAKIKVVAK